MTLSFSSDWDAYLIKTNSSGYAGFESSISLIPEIKTFPIPCNENLNIEIMNINDNTVEITIVNNTGQVVLNERKDLNDNIVSVNVAGLSAGLYYLAVHTLNFTVSKKIIIN
jgi:hypothetical protein